MLNLINKLISTFMFCLFCYLITISNTNPKILITSKQNDDSSFNTFYQQITKYSSYKVTNIDKYYQVYQTTGQFILSLNTVNHPTFFQINNTSKQAIFQNELILVNQNYHLDNNYIPSNLVEITNVPKIIRKNEVMLIKKEVLNHYSNLYIEMNKIGLNLVVYSGYRTYQKQVLLYNNAIDKNYLAKPGHSEHQTGLALDISTLDIGLTNHLANHILYTTFKEKAMNNGFIIRYEATNEHITGYPAEPWHLRYVGKDVAKIIYDNHLTFEEYLFQYHEIPL